MYLLNTNLKISRIGLDTFKLYGCIRYKLELNLKMAGIQI